MGLAVTQTPKTKKIMYSYSESSDNGNGIINNFLDKDVENREMKNGSGKRNSKRYCKQYHETRLIVVWLQCIMRQFWVNKILLNLVICAQDVNRKKNN